MKKQKAKDAAFIDKIKTIGISTGAKAPVCPNCNKPVSEHKMKLVGVAGIMMPERSHHDPSREAAFAE